MEKVHDMAAIVTGGVTPPQARRTTVAGEERVKAAVSDRGLPKSASAPSVLSAGGSGMMSFAHDATGGGLGYPL